MSMAERAMDDNYSQTLLNEIGAILNAVPEYADDRRYFMPNLSRTSLDHPSLSIEAISSCTARCRTDYATSYRRCGTGRQKNRVGAIEYLLTGTRFKATYRYPDDPEWSDDNDHREIVVQRYFGEKPIIYPPMPRGLPGLTCKL